LVALGQAIKGALVAGALKKAPEQGRPLPGFVHYFDQGVQDASLEYVDLLESNSVVIGMSCAGCRWKTVAAKASSRHGLLPSYQSSPGSTRHRGGAHRVVLLDSKHDPERC
jgi:hypothetical protein